MTRNTASPASSAAPAQPGAGGGATPSRVLIVEDDPGVCDMLGELLAAEGFATEAVGKAAELEALYAAEPPDVVLLDWHLPDGDGIDLLPGLKQEWPEAEIIVLTGFGTIEAAVEAVKRGAFHFQTKPVLPDSLVLTVRRACEHKQLRDQTQMLQNAVSSLSGKAPPTYKSPAMREVMRIVRRIAPSDVPVLLTGESGTGKEVIADLIHALSPRAHGPLIKVNCATLPPEKIESELFGALEGAYTGLSERREGLFRQAEGGTIFFDQITEMPLAVQSKLLRALQDHAYRPVGSEKPVQANCRVLAAMSLTMAEAIERDKLRADLYYRISTVTVDLPPLRERRADLIPLAEAFLRRFSAQAGRVITGFTPQALARIKRYSWPGNVRQLENEVQRAVLLCERSRIDADDLSIQPEHPSEIEEMVEPLEVGERNAILAALEQTGGNKTLAARRLGITRQTLYNKLRAWQSELPEESEPDSEEPE